MTDIEIQELQAKLATLQKENETLKSSNETLEKTASDLKKSGAVEPLPSFTLEKDVKIKNESLKEKPDFIVKKGKYQFTAPTFTWDDGRIVNVREVETLSDDEQEEYQHIYLQLVARGSGLIHLV